MLSFEDELDTNACLILNQAECEKNDKESSKDEDLNLDNLEFHLSPKWKRSAITSGLSPNKKTCMCTVPPPGSNVTFGTTQKTKIACVSAV